MDRAATGATLLLPLFLLHGRGIAEALLLMVAALFLLRSALLRDWAWVRGWVLVAAAWWGWLVLCSVPVGWAETAQAAGVARFLLLVAALEHWVLRQDWVRRWLGRLLAWSALYIAAQSLLQFATGRNAFGYPRGADGELTGPYQNPRAGAPLSRLLFPAVLPLLDRLATQGRAWAALLLLPAGVAVMVLIGQRMPLLLTLLGLFVTGLLLPRLRRFVLAGSGAVLGLLVLTSVASPPTFNRLVTKFTSQMEHFPDSHYGQIAARAVNIAQAHPWTGSGFDGFRRLCDDPAFFGGWRTGAGPAGDGGGAAMCVQHPHNFYLQALVEGGWPGLLLFTALAAAWLLRLFRGLWHEPDALRVGLFVAALIQLWPVASTTAFTSMPLSGWFFVLLGLGLAHAQHYITGPNVERA
ncbi:MAG: O-antigen ligase family protein [Janthinobacterium lividum]